MLQLTIDGQPVNISPECSLEIVKSNPFLTKIGEYTYDIDVDLRDPQNAKVYGHIDRLHSLSRPKGRTATLTDGARVICRGTEVLLETDGATAKIQILAGYSDFNYLIAGSGKIREMDFGIMPEPTKDVADAISTSFYPDVNFGFPEMYAKRGIPDKGDEDGDEDVDEIIYKGYICNRADYRVEKLTYLNTSTNPLKPQPYVLYYIEKFVELLGYQLTYNCLVDDPRWRRLMIIDSVWSLNYADHLPDWTADEFVDEIENFFDCLFLVDSLGGTVQIVSLKSYYQNNANVVTISKEDLLEDSSRSFLNGDSNDVIDATNVSYALPNHTYFKYADLDPEVERMCRFSDIDINDLESLPWDEKERVIYRDRKVGVEFAFLKESKKINNNIDTHAVYHQVNHLKRVERDESRSTKTLRIVPASVMGRIYVSSSSKKYAFLSPVSLEYTDTTVEQQSLPDMIENGVSTPNISDKMEVCFYLGKTLCRDAEEGILADTPCEKYYSTTVLTTEKHFDYINADVTPRVVSYQAAECGGIRHMTLSLDGEYGRVCTDFSSLSFDASEEHTIRFRTHKMLDPMHLYNIDNRLFFCKELRYPVKNGNLGYVVEGKMFPAI